MATSIDIICCGCGDTGSVARVTAGLQCQCGSTDLDLWTGSTDQHRLAAYAPSAPAPFVVQAYTEYPSQHVPTHQPPSTLPGWSEYQGPAPGQNVMSNGMPASMTCPVCHGSKMDPQGGYGPAPCRTCHGTGVYTPMTSMPEPMVARHPYPSNQTPVPFLGTPGGENETPRIPDSAQKGRHHGSAAVDEEGKHRRFTPGNPLASEYQLAHTDPGYSPYQKDQFGQRPKIQEFNRNNEESYYPRAPERSRAVNYRVERDYTQPPKQEHTLNGARCPNCQHEPLTMRKDHKEDAWVTCPNCGPLYNQDRNLDVNPWNLPHELPAGKFKATSAKTSRVRKTGRVLPMFDSVVRSNPGLSAWEALTLVRQTVARY